MIVSWWTATKAATVQRAAATLSLPRRHRVTDTPAHFEPQQTIKCENPAAQPGRRSERYSSHASAEHAAGAQSRLRSQIVPRSTGQIEPRPRVNRVHQMRAQTIKCEKAWRRARPRQRGEPSTAAAMNTRRRSQVDHVVLVGTFHHKRQSERERVVT